MLESLKEFLDKAWEHWLYLMGMLLMVEPLLDYWWAGYKTWADRFVSRKVRARIAITLSVTSVFLVSFMAFDDQYKETKEINAKLVKSDRLSEARRVAIEGIDGKGGLNVQVQELNNQLQVAAAATGAPILTYEVLEKRSGPNQYGTFSQTTIVRVKSGSPPDNIYAAAKGPDVLGVIIRPLDTGIGFRPGSGRTDTGGYFDCLGVPVGKIEIDIQTKDKDDPVTPDIKFNQPCVPKT